MLDILTRDQAFPKEFPKGAILLIDKPLAWTSFDVVNKVRYHLGSKLGIKKYKVGHAGTLDPLATGLLVLCVGEYTKKIDQLQSTDKEYIGTVTFGATTASLDLEKPVDETYPIEHLTDALIQSIRPQFLGDIQQIPPVFSAIKIDGKPVYKNARSGQEVVMEPRTVRIEELELGGLHPVTMKTEEHVILSSRGAPIHLYPDYREGLQVDFRVVCSKGTYIRTLAFDLGRAAGCGAYLSALRRTRSGEFSVDQAWDINDLVAWIKESS